MTDTTITTVTAIKTNNQNPKVGTDLVTIVNDMPVTTSLKIAEVFGKEHSKVIRSIETAIKNSQMASVSQTPFLASAFQKAEYQSEEGGRSYTMYYLNRNGLSFIVMGFTGEKAATWKWRYIEEFDRMERYIREQQQKVLSPLEILKQQVAIMEDLEKRTTQNTADIEQLKQAVFNPFSFGNKKLLAHDRKIDNHEERITKIENIGEDQGPVEEIHVIIKQAAERTGCQDYQAIWNEFYRAMRDNYGLDLNRRLTILKRKRVEQGWAKSKVNKLNRLDVITANPDIWQPVRAALQTIRTTWREEDERKAAEEQW